MSEIDASSKQFLESLGREGQLEVFKYLRGRFPIHPLEAEWGASAESILGAISRSGDLTQRGVRGILAEAIFEQSVVPALAAQGWGADSVAGEEAFDFVFTSAGRRARLQLKLQRSEARRPKSYPARSRRRLASAPDHLYVVEVQRTRTGKRKGKSTRPYSFGDFDVLGVNMHPSTGDWQRFMYTVADWLLPRPSAADLIDVFQPVAAYPDEFWTDDLARCLGWLFNRQEKRLYGGT